MNTEEGIEQIIKYLTNHNIKVKYEKLDGNFNRIIEFEIDGINYYIEWWINQSYLKLKNDFSVANLPFRYININPNSPTRKHKYQLCFYDIKNIDTGFLYNEIPFGSFKIPFN